MRLTGIVLVSFSLSFGASRYILDSELKTNFSDNGYSAGFLTAYTYDPDGNRVQQRVWSGTDSIASPMSSINYSNNRSGVVAEAVYLIGNDTSSIVRYIYDNEKLIAVRTLTKAGRLRFTDSLLYDESGRTIEEQRISSAGVKTYFHRYTFNAQGKKTADSLYELSSDSFAVTQALLFTYNTDFTVASEAQWRLSGKNWYCISTVVMTYSSGSLASAATHERNGMGTLTTDSLAYSYDTDGNRIKEEKFDENGSMAYRIVYTWHELRPLFVSVNGKSTGDNQFSLKKSNGKLFINSTFCNGGIVAIYNMAGKKISMTNVDNSGAAMIIGLYGKGSYIAVFTDGTNRRALNFTI